MDHQSILFMSFAGHVLDMIRKIRYNREQTEYIKAKQRAKLDKYVSAPQEQSFNADKFPEKSGPEKQRIQEEIKENLRKERNRRLIKASFLVILIIIMAYLLWIFFVS